MNQYMVGSLFKRLPVPWENNYLLSTLVQEDYYKNMTYIYIAQTSNIGCANAQTWTLGSTAPYRVLVGRVLGVQSENAPPILVKVMPKKLYCFITHDFFWSYKVPDIIFIHNTYFNFLKKLITFPFYQKCWFTIVRRKVD